jgi:dTDP-L-rhamnose 4-epimerase
MSRNVLVTGGAGFIGSHLVDRLVERGHAVTVIDNLDPQVHGPGASEPLHLAAHVAAGAVRFLRGDVCDRAALRQALEGTDSVVHLAAVVGVGQSMYQPHYYVHNNGVGSALLLELVVPLRQRVRKLIVASSMSLYGEGAYGCSSCGGSRPLPRSAEQMAEGRFEVQCARCGDELVPLPTPESKPPEIESVYAATKKHQEDLFLAFGRAYGIPTFALRFFNVFGPRQSLGNPYTGVAAIFLSRLLNERPPLVFEDGRQSRDFVDVRDIAEALLRAVEFDGDGAHVLNVGTGRRTTINDVADALASSLGVEIEPVRLGQYRAGDIRHCVADPTRARELLGFEARRTLAEGLPELIAWCREQRPPDHVEQSLDELVKQGLVR